MWLPCSHNVRSSHIGLAQFKIALVSDSHHVVMMAGNRVDQETWLLGFDLIVACTLLLTPELCQSAVNLDWTSLDVPLPVEGTTMS